MKCNECNGHLYGCPYEDYDIQECDEGKTLTGMTELAYNKGGEDAITEFVGWYINQDSYCKVSSGGKWKFTKFDEMTEVDIIAEFKKAKGRMNEIN